MPNEQDNENNKKKSDDLWDYVKEARRRKKAADDLREVRAERRKNHQHDAKNPGERKPPKDKKNSSPR